MSSAQIGVALEEGRLSDAAEAYAGFIATCPSSKRHQYLRLDLSLAAARGDRELGARLFEELLASPPLLDTATLLNHVVVLVENLLTLGVAPDDVRRRAVRRWLAAHPSNAAVRAHGEGLLLLAGGRRTTAAAVALGSRARRTRPVPGQAGHRHVAHGARRGPARRRRSGRCAGRPSGGRSTTTSGAGPGVRKDRAEALARRLQGASTRVDGELTAREREVAALLADGLTNGQLAERLFISPKTAAVHVSNILAKLGLSTRAEIAAWAVRHDVALSGVIPTRRVACGWGRGSGPTCTLPAMGQMVAVTEKPSSSPGIVRFELNRALTGMGHERFRSAADAFGPRPAAELARRLFATGQAARCTSTPTSSPSTWPRGPRRPASPTSCATSTSTGSRAWRRRRSRTSSPRRSPPPRAPPAAGGDGEGDAALAEAAKRVPMHLLERSRAARERWKAKAG